jgi:undecaprenyl-diphosphatase
MIVAGVSAVLFAVLSALVAARAPALMRADASVSGAALRFALGHPAWQSVLRAFTATGGPTVVIIGTAVAAGALLRWGRRRDAAFLLAVVLGTTGLRLIVLAAVARPRPAERLAPVIGWSFPSGHSTASAAIALAAVVLLGRRALLAAAVLGWAVLIGVSRVALVVHWPSDVLGAWLMVIPVVVAATTIRRSGLSRRRE